MGFFPLKIQRPFFELWQQNFGQARVPIFARAADTGDSLM
jgi:hypothetical protein